MIYLLISLLEQKQISVFVFKFVPSWISIKQDIFWHCCDLFLLIIPPRDFHSRPDPRSARHLTWSMQKKWYFYFQNSGRPPKIPFPSLLCRRTVTCTVAMHTYSTNPAMATVALCWRGLGAVYFCQETWASLWQVARLTHVSWGTVYSTSFTIEFTCEWEMLTLCHIRF